MITPQEMFLVVTYLAKAGYLTPVEGQSVVWADAVNQKTDKGTLADAQEVARKIASEPHRWIASGDLVSGISQRVWARVEKLGPAPYHRIEALADDREADIKFRIAWVNAGLDGHGLEDRLSIAYAAMGQAPPPPYVEMTREEMNELHASRQLLEGTNA